MLVTGGVFVAITWISGAALLPLWIKDAGIRWLIATAAGLALSGSAALWGKSYATASQEPPAEPAPAAVTASGARSIAMGGELTGIASTGDGTRIDRRVQRDSDTPQSAPPPLGGLTAAGERSIAAGGGISGIASTGDETNTPER